MEEHVGIVLGLDGLEHRGVLLRERDSRVEPVRGSNGDGCSCGCSGDLVTAAFNHFGRKLTNSIKYIPKPHDLDIFDNTLMVIMGRWKSRSTLRMRLRKLPRDMENFQ